jgi:hypothetical protein
MKNKKIAELARNILLNNVESILIYLDEAKNLMYKDESQVRETIGILKLFIYLWSKRCESYPYRTIVEKTDLQDKEKWYVKDVHDFSQNTRTSGSTTGVPFEYLRFSPVFEKIEWDYHYNLVLDEFEINQSPHILYMMPHHYKRQNNKCVFSEGRSSDLNLVNHGSKRSPIIHYADFEHYKNDRENFFHHLFEYIKENPIDVFYASAPEINSMCSYVKKFEIKHKLGFLLSNTNEKLYSSDAAFLLENKFFDHICDHMRCWDGGASFFTCKYKTYHLMDEISWAESIDGKLVSTDYFNLSSPFISYWNGDYCHIGKEYKRCECGRLYREFDFLENRPFSLKGVCLKEIKDKMKELQIQGIKQVRCAPEFLEVVSNKELSEEEKAKINNLSDKFKFKFSFEM